jgi:hypothetical protein
MKTRQDDKSGVIRLRLSRMHAGQINACRAFFGHRRTILRAGRRWGKTVYAKNWISQGLIQGQRVAWFAPQNRTWAEIYADIGHDLGPIISSRSKSSGVIRTITDGRVDFWTLENSIAGRGRGYNRIVIDEAAFAKDGDNKTDGSTMAIFEMAILPTLYDYSGEILICSNSAGKDPNNFFYNVCTDPQYGFYQYHAPTMDNPLLPQREPNESAEAWLERRTRLLAELKRDNDPLVYAQEYLAEFVDWSGVAFFAREKLLVNNQPVPYPTHCDSVFAVIDTASKTGTDNDATGVTYFAVNKHQGIPLTILDWDIVQIEGATLETWLPSVFSRLEELSLVCRARFGSLGAWIEDKNSGTILLQQARNRAMNAHPIKTKLTSMGKDERAFSASTYVHRGDVKYTEYTFNKTSIYKRRSRNHLMEQIESFRIGDKKSDREDDLLDTFCYGIAIALGNREGI